MDLATAAGIFMAWALVMGAIILGGDVGAFLDVPSFLITFGGSLSVTVASNPFPRIKLIPQLLRSAFFTKNQNLIEVLNMMIRFAERARREGLLALEDEAAGLEDPFIKKGIQLVVDGTDPELVKNILDAEISFLEERHKSNRLIFEVWGEMAPAFGMLGTLIGLIQMLGHLDDPNALGPGMAVALITTFYGSIIANAFALPIAKKLAVRTEEEILLREMVVEGVLAIQAGENPRIVEEKLKVYLPPALRLAYESSKKKPEEEGT